MTDCNSSGRLSPKDVAENGEIRLAVCKKSAIAHRNLFEQIRFENNVVQKNAMLDWSYVQDV